MKKIVLVLALLLCVILACTSCGKDLSPAELYENNPIEERYPALTTAESIYALSDYNFDSSKSAGELLYFVDEDGEYYKVYNAETNSVVLSGSAEDHEVSVFSVYGIYFVKVVSEFSDEKDTTTIYNANGVSVASATDYSAPDVSTSLDMFEFDNVIYRVDEEGGVEEVCESVFFDLSSYDCKTTEHYFVVDDNEISVYDLELNNVFYWEYNNDNCDEMEILILSDKYVLAQALVELAQDESEYDVLMDGDKYDLVSIILNVKNGKENEVDLNYFVNDIMYIADEVNSYEYDAFQLPDGADVLAYITYIENKAVIDDEVYVTLNPKNAKVKKTVAEEYDAYYRIDEDLWFLRYKSGDTVLADDKCEVIAKFENPDEITASYIVANGKIFDFSLTELYDLKSNDMTVYATLANNIILADEEGDKYLFNGSATVNKIEDFNTHSNQYYVTVDDGDYTFYNENGAVITSKTLSSYTQIYSNDDNTLKIFKLVDEDYNISYYAFK
ncbi:MAG: hypothetical protein IKV16_04660 [Clostridia bacterium]|nr:hypothetical protein [Clostridia bacterium]